MQFFCRLIVMSRCSIEGKTMAESVESGSETEDVVTLLVERRRKAMEKNCLRHVSRLH
jgi:hypothetical protein